MKYDTDGNQLWVARYNGPSNRADFAAAIAVDKSGNVYVTGSSQNGRTSDYATIKYDSAGNQLWVAYYDGPEDGEDGATALALDGAGNIYVTGWSQDGIYSFATVKYDSAGNQLWVARYGEQDWRQDQAFAIAVDNLGNVYVAGLSMYINDNKYIIVKYDSAGNQLWVKQYGVPYDSGTPDLAVDSSGNVLVSYCYDYATLKYSPDGTQLWEENTMAPHGDYTARAITTDGDWNVYVTGSSYGGPVASSDFATVKYDASGNQLWVARYNSPDNRIDDATDIAVDNGGNVYVTGCSSTGTPYGVYVTVKYDSAGHEIWASRYTGADPSYEEAYPHALVTDKLGNAFVTGYSRGPYGPPVYTTIKYASSATLPTVATNAAGNITTSSAILNGNLTDIGHRCKRGGVFRMGEYHLLRE